MRLGKDVSGASFGELDGHVNPLRLLAALHRAFINRGGELRNNHAVTRISKFSLRSTELEPEWVDAANFARDGNEALYGPKPDRPWPELGARDRLAVYLSRGTSEGWIVYVDHIGYAGEAPNRTTALQKLLVAKTLSQQHAWDLVRAISKMLDVT